MIIFIIVLLLYSAVGIKAAKATFETFESRGLKIFIHEYGYSDKCMKLTKLFTVISAFVFWPLLYLAVRQWYKDNKK